MSQHDYVIANDTHPNLRADLNLALAAIVTGNNGASAPSATYANMIYANTSTTPNKYYVRNNGNSAWATLFTDTGLICAGDGAVGAPSIGWNSTRTHGLYYGSSTTWSGAVAGVNAFTIGTTLVSFNASANDVDMAIGATGGGANSLFVQGSDGFVGIGTGTPVANLHISKESGSNLLIAEASTSATNGALIIGRKARNTIASPAALSSGDDIFRINTQAYHSTGTPGYATVAQIIFECDGGESGDTVPCNTRFLTLPAGGTITERMRITSGGYVGVGRSPDTSGQLFQVANSNTTASGIANYYSADDANPPYFQAYKSRGTVAVPTAVTASDAIFGHIGWAYANSAYRQATVSGPTVEVVSGSIVQARDTFWNQNHLGTVIQRECVGCYKSLSNNTTTTVISLTAATLLAAGCTIRYGVEVVDGTDIQMESGTVTLSVVNKGGVFTVDLDKSTTSQAASSGTLTVTWSVTSANPALVQINSNSSLTPTGTRLVYGVLNVGGQAMAIS